MGVGEGLAVTESGTEESTQPSRWPIFWSPLRAAETGKEVGRLCFPSSGAFLGPDAVSTASSPSPLQSTGLLAGSSDPGGLRSAEKSWVNLAFLLEASSSLEPPSWSGNDGDLISWTKGFRTSEGQFRALEPQPEAPGPQKRMWFRSVTPLT
ncbi:hypothetical protein E5288_WYG007037 [Bos mutus]|uniref:Uncharacterized protein n=1 Tax=Bos mutus TaxID=72004 RepID=A0A6B0QW99_9CETA|nr:hypothetical protein [Bos mutus]